MGGAVEKCGVISITSLYNHFSNIFRQMILCIFITFTEPLIYHFNMVKNGQFPHEYLQINIYGIVWKELLLLFSGQFIMSTQGLLLMFCRKRWYLFDPRQTAYLYPTRLPYEESSVYSEVNIRWPDLRKHPLFSVSFR